MIGFLKKYWINILLIATLAILIFLFIPNQESHYLKPDADSIRKKSRLVLFWTEIILFGTTLFFVIRNFKKTSDLLYSIGALGIFSLGFFFLFDSIFLSAAFLINKLSTKQMVDKKYNVVYVDNEKNILLLRDNTLNKSIQADRLLTENKNLFLNTRDTLIVSFSKGLLGFNFDPMIKIR